MGRKPAAESVRSPTHAARLALFRRGWAEGKVTLAEVEAATPAGLGEPWERRLLVYCLTSAGIAVEPPKEERMPNELTVTLHCRLLALLEQLEWSGSDGFECPSCEATAPREGKRKPAEHGKDCELDALISLLHAMGGTTRGE